MRKAKAGKQCYGGSNGKQHINRVRRAARADAAAEFERLTGKEHDPDILLAEEEKAREFLALLEGRRTAELDED